MNSETLIGNSIEHRESTGYFINVFDHRPETLAFMDRNELQGGGPTWAALVTAALDLESPETLQHVEFDDESDVVLSMSQSESHLKVVQSYVALLMSDEGFMQQCINKANSGGYLE